MLAHSPIRRFASRIFPSLSPRLDPIQQHKDVATQIDAERTGLLQNISKHQSDGTDVQSDLLGLTILNHATDFLQRDGRLAFLRRASQMECSLAEVPFNMRAQEKLPLSYHFLETYGYRFTLLVDLKATRATVLDFARVQSKMLADTKASLKAAHAKFETLT